MSGHYSKEPYCLSCRTQIKQNEISIHEVKSHKIDWYVVGGYGLKPKEVVVEKPEIKEKLDFTEIYEDENES